MTKIKNCKWLAIAALALLIVLSAVFAFTIPKEADAAGVDSNSYKIEIENVDTTRTEAGGEPRLQWKNGDVDGEYVADFSRLYEATKDDNGWDNEKNSWGYDYSKSPIDGYLNIKTNYDTPVYLKLSYNYPLATNSGRVKFKFLLDNESYCGSGYGEMKGTENISSDDFVDFYYGIPSGEHTFSLDFHWDSSKYFASEDMECTVKDIKIQAEPFKYAPDLTIEYNSRLSDLYIWRVVGGTKVVSSQIEKKIISKNNGEGIDADTYKVQIPYGQLVSFDVKAKEGGDIPSSIYEGETAEIETQATSNFVPKNSFAWTASSGESYSLYAVTDNIDGTRGYHLGYNKQFAAVNIIDQGSGYKTLSQEDSSQITYSYLENQNSSSSNKYAKITEKIEIKANARISKNGVVEGDPEEGRPLIDGETIVFPVFAEKDNSILVMLKNGMNDLLSQKFTVTLDGTRQTDVLDLSGYSSFSMNDVTYHEVKVTANIDDEELLKLYKPSAMFSFTVLTDIEDDELGIKNAVLRGNFSDPDKELTEEDGIKILLTPGIGNGSNLGWRLDLEQNQKDQKPYAYRALSSLRKDETTSNSGRSSVIGFDFSELKSKGSLSFDFMIKGNYFTSGFNFKNYGAHVYYNFSDKLSTGSSNDYVQSQQSGDTDPLLLGTHRTKTHKIARTESNGISYGENVTPMGTWAHFSIQIDPEALPDGKIMRLFFSAIQSKDNLSPQEQSFVIRNICFVKENEVSAQTTIKLAEAIEGAKVTATMSGVEGPTEITDAEGKVLTASFGSAITLKAEVPEGKKLYGWFVDGIWTGDDLETSVIVKADESQIIAEIRDIGYYQIRSGNKFYRTLADALQTVKTGDIYFIENTTITGTITVPSGVALILPYNATGSYAAQGGNDITTKPSWLVNEAKYRYLTVTFDEQTNMTIEGDLFVGGVVCNPYTQAFQGHTSGAYSELVNNGKITVAKGGVLDVYGRVRGTGSIDVQSGAKMLEPFLILDFAGGMNAFNCFGSNHTPFKRYAMNNVECEFTINYGAQLIGHATLYALGSLISLDQPFIGSEKDEATGFGDGVGKAMVLLKKDSSVTMTYDPNKVVGTQDSGNENCVEGVGQITMDFNGGATFSYMVFTAFGISIPTYTVYFSIPYNYNIVMTKGDFETITDFMIMPGGTVTVGKEATLTLNASAWIYDGLTAGESAGKTYPSANELETAGYSKSGNLIVNGTLKIAQKIDMGEFKVDLTGGIDDVQDFDRSKTIPATFLGIVQTDGESGRIEILANTILSGTIADGISGQNWFEYQTTARVWDKAHNRFADLTCESEEVAEKEAPTKWTIYTAKSSDTFTVGSINYSNAKGGAAGGVTQVMSIEQEMHGSWMKEHEGHTFDWSKLLEEDLAGVNFYDMPLAKKITRICDELGCDQEEHKNLLFGAGKLGEIEYNKSTVTSEQFKAMFEALFGKENLLDTTTATFECDPQASAGTGYSVTVKLANAYWLDFSSFTFVDSMEMTYDITRKAITVKANAQESTFGDEYSIKQDASAITAEGLIEGDQISFNISVKEQEHANAGTYHLTVSLTEGGSNANYDVTLEEGTYTVNRRKVTVTVDSLTSAQGDNLVENYGYKVTTGNFVGQDEDTFKTKFEGYTCEADKNTVKTYPITMNFVDGVTKEKLASGETMSNYEITIVDGVYTVTESVFKGVEFSDDTVTYDGGKHTLSATGVPGGAVVKYSYKTEGVEEWTALPEGGFTNAGTYTIKVEISLAGHEMTYEGEKTLTIKQVEITVTISKQSKTYDKADGEVSSEKDVDWKLKEGSSIVGDDDLGITLALDKVSVMNEAGKYNITGSASNKNYKVTFEGGTEAYEILKKKLTVTAKNQESTYGDEPVKVNTQDAYTVDGWIEDAPLTVNVSHEVTKTSGYAQDGYVISVNVPEQIGLKNYDLTTNNGTYTVKKLVVDVKINDQQDVYAYGGKYKWNESAWEVDESKLANGEKRNDLKITLEKPQWTNAGDYEINGSCGNLNYDVKFAKGTYKLEKQTISHNGENVIFVLRINDDDFNEQNPASYRFNGENFTLSASVSVREGDDFKQLEYTLNMTEIDKAGTFEITITVNDTNYQGSKDYTVEIFTAEGFSQNLFDVLTELQKIAGDITPDALTTSQEHFELVKNVKAQLAKLSESDKELGEEQLAKYVALVDAWNNAANISDDVIETAKTMADAPIMWLFAMAQLSALICAMYVIGKGGLL